MLYSILSSGGSMSEKLLLLLISVLALLPALTVHEWAHGYTAYKLGDSTAKADGRLSLNPLDHLDPFGTLMLLLVGFGWAKPVPVNTRYFKKPRRDFALTSLAGPISNILLGFVSTLLYVFAVYACSAWSVSEMTAMVVINVFYFSALYNLGLGLFNLIPLPPLDGSNI
ncbi:MAG: site-2 protease family protein, partial [Clostridia bacterium]|nr:site-2 protease family protein [Clostridia bacterium]